jgi:hypothetical protein
VDHEMEIILYRAPGPTEGRVGPDNIILQT